MKKIFKTSICIILLFLISSCNSFNSASSYSKGSVENSSNTNQDYQSVLSRMNALESEVDLLKERLLKIENLSFLIDAKEYNDGLRIYLGKTSINETFNSIDIKLPIKNYNKLQIVIAIGKEKDGIVSLDKIILPGYGEETNFDKYNEYGINSTEFRISTLLFDDAKYDKDTCMMIFVSDQDQFKHYEFVHSENASGDV